MTNRPLMINLAAEPEGKAYRQLLAFAFNRCARFSLVWREDVHFDASASDVALALLPFHEREDRTSQWPGTTLIGQDATIRYYRTAPGALVTLEQADRLYAWMAPQRPEDLTFYVADGRYWLASISHERDAWFNGEILSNDDIIVNVSGVVIS